MSDLDPEIWNNPTLGAATTAPFLDELEAQAAEDRMARLEGRPARIVKRAVRHPQEIPSGSVPSNITTELVYEEPSADSVIASIIGGTDDPFAEGNYE